MQPVKRGTALLWQKIKEAPARLSAIPESPQAIARAFAVGVFIGMMPGPGLAIALAAALFFRLSKVATLLGAFVTNPWTSPFIYVASYQLGLLLVRVEEPVIWKSVLLLEPQWHRELLRALPPLFIGATALGLLAGTFFYGVVWALIWRYRRIRLRHPGAGNFKTPLSSREKA